MKDANRELVQKIQSDMVESARATFEEPQLDSLRCVIRLTVEFYHYLKFGNPGLREIIERDQHRLGGIVLPPMSEMERDYSIESIFSGIASFRSVNGSYKVLVGATQSTMRWDGVSQQSLKDLFVSTFDEFCKESVFEVQCRLLLDLFKIQIVFAGMFYE